MMVPSPRAKRDQPRRRRHKRLVIPSKKLLRTENSTQEVRLMIRIWNFPLASVRSSFAWTYSSYVAGDGAHCEKVLGCITSALHCTSFYGVSDKVCICRGFGRRSFGQAVDRWSLSSLTINQRGDFHPQLPPSGL